MAQVQHEISGRDAYKSDAEIHIHPVSKGTWTVVAFYKGKSKRFTGLAEWFDVTGAVVDAQDWIDAQAA
jgi:hypothetical protein